MFGFGPVACSTGAVDYKKFPSPKEDLPVAADAGPQTVVLAGGCFWCTEAVYQNVPGVTDVESGYAGGTKETANYEAVCTGSTAASIGRPSSSPTTTRNALPRRTSSS